jgi:flavin reductase (DIM6/NTAB) family NADH-FMN oxidoreductase RutF
MVQGKFDMAKVKVDYKEYFAETVKQMCETGLLLVTQGKDCKANIMTIGWGTIGSVWGKPVFIVLVRPSRYTYDLLDEVNEFTVNVPSKKLTEAAVYCGTVSGRDEDKFEEMKLTATVLPEVRVPIIEECDIHFLCRNLHQHHLDPDMLDSSVKQKFYPKGDFHQVYYGEIVATYANG